VFRLVQEALNNVARHAQAEHAAIYARYSPQRVEVRISDDGLGFDPTSVPPGRLGLGGMRERAAGIGAALSVTSRPGAGTEIRVVWPAASADAAV
jgi:signal transduction histidine kinase